MLTKQKRNPYTYVCTHIYMHVHVSRTRTHILTRTGTHTILRTLTLFVCRESDRPVWPSKPAIWPECKNRFGTKKGCNGWKQAVAPPYPSVAVVKLHMLSCLSVLHTWSNFLLRHYALDAHTTNLHTPAIF